MQSNKTDTNCRRDNESTIRRTKGSRMIDYDKLKLAHPKFKIGQKVWYINNEDEPHEFIVSDIDNTSEEIYFDDEFEEWWTEEQLYESKEELIDVQIKYWNSFRDKENNPDCYCNGDDTECGYCGYKERTEIK